MATTHRLFDTSDEPPPTYTPFPRPEEQSIDAGAGAPIVRATPAHVVVNPSDPRSDYAREFFGTQNVTYPPSRSATIGGPLPRSRGVPPRLQFGYENMAGPQVRSSAPQTPDATGDATNPLYRPVTAEVPLTSQHVSTSVPPVPGRYMAVNDSRTQTRVVSQPSTLHYGSYPGHGHTGQPPAGPMPGSWGSGLQGGYSAVATLPANVTYSVCPHCLNSGWVRSSVPCNCVAGVVARDQFMRPRPTNFFDAINGLFDPQRRTYTVAYGPAPPVPPRSGAAPPPMPPRDIPYQPEPFFAPHVPGSGQLCPNCR
ncbi:hypothetical protein EC988_005256, partial [Linderina pennispora]